MKNSVLLITEKYPELQELLQEECIFVVFNSCYDALRYLNDEIRGVSAALIDAELAITEEGHFLRELRRDPRYGFLPALILTEDNAAAEVSVAFSLGAVDVIHPREDKAVILNRIANAVRIKDSRTFSEMENMLRELPCNIYLKDSEGRYVFLSHYWHHLKGLNDPNWTPRGKTDPEVRKDTENARHAYETDMEIIRSGVGKRYIIEANVDDITEYIDITKRPIRDAEGNVTGIIALLVNVTEQELLKKQLKVASITDGMTGLYNRSEIQRQIKAEMQKGEDSMFSLIMADIDNFKHVNDTYGHAIGDRVICALAEILKSGKGMEKKAFVSGRWGGEEFMLFLPGVRLDTAGAIAETIRQSFSATVFPTAGSQTISIGVTEYKPNDTLDSLCTRVDAALYRAKFNGKNRIEVL